MEIVPWLAYSWAILLAIAVFIYVVLDGFDLGIGIQLCQLIKRMGERLGNVTSTKLAKLPLVIGLSIIAGLRKRAII